MAEVNKMHKKMYYTILKSSFTPLPNGSLSKVIVLPTIAIAIVLLFLVLKGDSQQITVTFC